MQTPGEKAAELADAFASAMNTLALLGAPRGIAALRAQLGDDELKGRLQRVIAEWKESLRTPMTAPPGVDPERALMLLAELEPLLDTLTLDDPTFVNRVCDTCREILGAMGIGVTLQQLEELIAAAEGTATKL